MVSSVARPVKELRGFERIKIKSGDSTKVEFQILPGHLAFTKEIYRRTR